MDLAKFSLNHAMGLGQSGKLILPPLVTIPVVSTRIKSAKFQIKFKNLNITDTNLRILCTLK